MKEIEIHFKGGDGKRIKTLPEVPDNSDYVDLSTPQDIDGKKNFIQTPTINGKDIATQEKLNEVSNSKENISNKVTSISSLSTDDEYPSAKCVYDIVGNIETLLGGI